MTSVVGVNPIHLQWERHGDQWILIANFFISDFNDFQVFLSVLDPVNVLPGQEISLESVETGVRGHPLYVEVLVEVVDVDVGDNPRELSGVSLSEFGGGNSDKHGEFSLLRGRQGTCYGTVQYSTVPYGTVQYSTVQYRIVHLSWLKCFPH